MRKLIMIAVLAALIIIAALPAAAQAQTQTPESAVAVTLERTACFGTCPVYTVTIYTDGTVVYNGERFVDVEGEQTANIGAEAVQQLVASFEAAGYFNWNDEYTDMHVSDLPTITTSVIRDGITKQITRYAGDDSAPLALPYLETWIDIVANTRQWTGDDTPLTTVMGAQAPVITLERTQCFGTCPVYTLSVFEDGTVVYTGIQYVDVMGVQVGHIEPSAVEMLVRGMTATGYFDWNDEYTHMTITDQPSVITSLSTEDGYKRITRYDGDANAPVGLTWLEDRIDRAVNVEQWVGAQ